MKVNNAFLHNFMSGFNAVGYLFAPPRLRAEDYAEDYYVDIGDVWKSVGDSMGEAMGLRRDSETEEWVRMYPAPDHLKQYIEHPAIRGRERHLPYVGSRMSSS